MNTTSTLGFWGKLGINLIRTVFTMTGSVPARDKAHFKNRFPPTVPSMLSQTVFCINCKSGIAVHRCIGPYSALLLTWRTCCKIFFLGLRDVAECHMRLLRMHNWHFKSPAPISADLPRTSKEHERCGVDDGPFPLVSACLVPKRIE